VPNSKLQSSQLLCVQLHLVQQTSAAVSFIQLGDIGDEGDGSVELMARSNDDDHEVRSSFCFAATTSQLQQALTVRRQARGHQRRGDIGG
jgi:hypothetical protein